MKNTRPAAPHVLLIAAMGFLPALSAAEDHAHPADHHHHETATRAQRFEIPASITAEHRELHEDLAKAIKSGGETAKAAKRVEEALSAHFEKEEAYALPPLALLVPVSKGVVTPDMEEIVVLAEHLQEQLPEMLHEHEAIVAALKDLATAAMREEKDQAAHFAERLMQHARTEEEILYPAAILVGKQARLLLKK